MPISADLRAIVCGDPSAGGPGVPAGAAGRRRVCGRLTLRSIPDTVLQTFARHVEARRVSKENGLRLGWIGAGRMGFALCSRLLADGHDVAVWNRTCAKAEPLAEQDATI